MLNIETLHQIEGVYMSSALQRLATTAFAPPDEECLHQDSLLPSSPSSFPNARVGKRRSVTKVGVEAEPHDFPDLQ